ncbi:MAG: hypothetical protein ACI81L_000580 [Verrucomicrobiales bacterium]
MTREGPQPIIGLGSGRCGTVSLSLLLNGQLDSEVTHESRPVLPWQFDRDVLRLRTNDLLDRTSAFAGDVAYYYLPYVRTLASENHDIRFLCLERDFEEVVSSMMAKTEGRNHWVDHDGSHWANDPVWDPTMPTYSSMEKEIAVRRYVREYYQMARRLEHDLTNFRIFPTAALNGVSSQLELLEFCGFPQPVPNANIRENRLLS